MEDTFRLLVFFSTQISQTQFRLSSINLRLASVDQISLEVILNIICLWNWHFKWNSKKSLLAPWYAIYRIVTKCDQNGSHELSAQFGIKNSLYACSWKGKLVKRSLKADIFSLKLFLRNLCGEKNNDLKVSSIGQAIMQLIRPRTLVSPLQVRFEAQLHHIFASRFFVSSLNSLGFCSSFFEVQRFESNASLSQGLYIPGDLSQSLFSMLLTMSIIIFGRLMETTPFIVWASSV